MTTGEFPHNPDEVDPSMGQVGQLVPLTNDLISTILDFQDSTYFVDDDGDIIGVWNDQRFHFYRVGPDDAKSVFQVRMVSQRRFAIDDVPRLYELSNQWNRERFWPKAYVHIFDDGSVAVCGELIADLAAGVTVAQLDQLISCAVATGLQLADSLADL